jgi:hypothetical protein
MHRRWLLGTNRGCQHFAAGQKMPSLLTILSVRRILLNLTRVNLIVAWYDFWIGIFWDRAKRRLYILPIPMIGIMIEFSK